MSVFNRDLVVQLLNKLLNKADLTVAKTDDVLADTKQILTAVSGGMGVVKSVQRGVCNLADAVEVESTPNGWVMYESTIRINTVNPERSFVLVYGHTNFYDEHGAFLRRLNSNELVIGIKKPGSEGSLNGVSWQVIEFY